MFSRSQDIKGDVKEPGEKIRQATILLVEDEQRVRDVMELTLSLDGYHVLSVGSASEALEIIDNYSDKIDLMVTDFAMPQMNGAALAAKLKRVRPQVKVLYVSGFQKQEVLDFQEKSVRASAEFLQKPFTPEALEVKVRNLLAEAA